MSDLSSTDASPAAIVNDRTGLTAAKHVSWADAVRAEPRAEPDSNSLSFLQERFL